MFMERFAPLVESGVKRQTIRPVPKRMPKAGERESWRQWRGKPYRSKTRELAVVELTRVRRILIRKRGGFMLRGISFESPFYLEVLAKRDGFKDWRDFLEWFRKQHGLPFKGIVIEARDA